MTTNNDLQQMSAIDECYVKISDLKKAIERNPYDPKIGDITAYLRYLKYNTPIADAEPVIRCKDCEWWDRIYDDGPFGYCHACKHGFHSGNWDISIYRKYKEDFFCADGERRTDE